MMNHKVVMTLLGMAGGLAMAQVGHAALIYQTSSPLFAFGDTASAVSPSGVQPAGNPEVFGPLTSPGLIPTLSVSSSDSSGDVAGSLVGPLQYTFDANSITASVLASISTTRDNVLADGDSTAELIFSVDVPTTATINFNLFANAIGVPVASIGTSGYLLTDTTGGNTQATVAHLTPGTYQDVVQLVPNDTYDLHIIVDTSISGTAAASVGYTFSLEAPGGGAGTPEPASLGILGIGAVGLLRRRRV